MRKKILKVCIVCMLLITLTAINFIAVGADLVSYALENSVEIAKTNQKNVGFSAYLKNAEGEKVPNADLDINLQEMKLYLNVEVSREGYFNGAIKLNNSNFEFVTSQSESVNKVTSDTVTLNQINAGSSPEIEVIVKPKVAESLDLNLLNMKSELELTGIYKDSSEKDNKVEGKTTVQISYVSTVTEAEINNQLEVLTNELGMYNGEQKRILQVSLKAGVKDNSFPIKNITSQISVPKIGDKEPQIEEKANLSETTKWNAQHENGTVTVNMENEPNKENKINWVKSGDEEIILTYIYDKDVVIDNVPITGNTTITLQDGKTITTNTSTANVNKDEVKVGIITVKGETEQDIYKGNLYAGLDEQYTSKTEIQVNLDKVAETIYVNENATSIPTNYNRTVVNKKELFSILGNDGKLEISTKTPTGSAIIAPITNSTPEDENGNIIVDYPEGVDNITIRTTRAENKGNITLQHLKSIKAGNIATLKATSEIKAVLDGTFDTRSTEKGTIPAKEVTTKLNETTTEARLEVNRESLSTITENKNVEIKAVLLSNAKNYDLYRNPTLEIELPADVSSVKLNSINKIYGDEFAEVIPSQGIVNGRQVIRVELKGAQTAYKEPGIEGTEIRINADLELNEKATSKQDTIKMTYTNENANQYKENATVGTEVVNMEVVSPKGLITTNNMVALDVQTIGEQDKTSKLVERKSAAKTVKVEKEIINNNETPVKEVSILGRFATDGEENNLHVALKSAISVEGIDTNKVKVYYTENEKATADLTNNENGWKDSATSETKKYLVTITEMQVVEGAKLSYDMEIPENLEYNQKAEEGYEVSYVESNTGIAQQVKATTIELTTGTGPVVETKLSAKLGTKNLKESQEVKQGEIITYKTEVKNTGTEVAQEVKVVAEVPDGVTVLDDKKEQTVNDLQPGETRTVEYEAQVGKEVKENSEISARSAISYQDVEKQTNIISNKVAGGDISVFIENVKVGAYVQAVTENEVSLYRAKITNLTDSEKKNIKLSWNLPEEFNIESQNLLSQEQFSHLLDLNYTGEDTETGELPKDKNITIDSIPANSYVVVSLTVIPKEVEEDTEFTISASADLDNKTYDSNLIEDVIKNDRDYEVKLSANKENEYVKAGDVIEYTINVKSLSGNNSEVVLKDQIASRLSVKEVMAGNEKIETSGNDLNIPVTIGAGEEKAIKVSTVVNYKEDSKADEQISNKAVLYAGADVTKTSNEVSHTVMSNAEGEEFVDENGNVTHTYKISGVAWEDQNVDGARDDSESALSGISVQLLNTATNELAKNPRGETITATTGTDGSYTLSGIPNGEYLVVFKYDASIYRLTEYQRAGVDATRNSNAISRKLALNGEEATYGVTDAIAITENSIANINIGLAKSEKFDLRLDKYVSKVVAQTSSGTQTFNYNEETLAKVELKAKEVAGARAIIEYKIKVTNAGELEGYVKNIVDYLPKDLTFTSELNKDWYQEGTKIYNNSLSNQKLAPGESREVTLTVTKNMTEDNTGLINNLAEIQEDYNEAGMTDINSTPGNKTQGENDMGSADTIISVKTGGPVVYTMLTLAILIVLAGGVFFVGKEIKMKDEII